MISTLRVTLLALLVVLISATGSFAQDVKGSFTLPFAVSWGGADLQPGPYTFHLNADDRNILSLHHDGGTVYVKLGYTDTVKNPDRRSELVTVTYNKRPCVNELYVADLKTAFYFAIPLKFQVSTTVIATNKDPETIARVPIEISKR